jgi:hypothetical protein
MAKAIESVETRALPIVAISITHLQSQPSHSQTGTIHTRLVSASGMLSMSTSLADSLFGLRTKIIQSTRLACCWLSTSGEHDLYMDGRTGVQCY